MNAAQTILEQLGVAVGSFPKQAHGAKNPSPTKAGPGRYHGVATKERAAKTAGATADFVLHTNPGKKDRRDLIAIHGRRQYLRLLKGFRAQHKADNDERSDALSTRHYEAVEA